MSNHSVPLRRSRRVLERVCIKRFQRISQRMMVGNPAIISPSSIRMSLVIRKVAVLGAGTMGARIAAHVANAGFPCVLLDIVPPGTPTDADKAARNKIVAAGFEAAKKS